MKEEQFKKIIKKSTLETSENFVDELMVALEKSKVTKRSYFSSSFTSILVVCIVLVVGLTFLLFKILGSNTEILNSMTGIQKIPIFIAVTLILLHYLNEIIKLNRNSTRSIKGRQVSTDGGV